MVLCVIEGMKGYEVPESEGGWLLVIISFTPQSSGQGYLGCQRLVIHGPWVVLRRLLPCGHSSYLRGAWPSAIVSSAPISVLLPHTFSSPSHLVLHCWWSVCSFSVEPHFKGRYSSNSSPPHGGALPSAGILVAAFGLLSELALNILSLASQ
ncbi:hypothetical protein ES703_30842 [subsurface metagenome]